MGKTLSPALLVAEPDTRPYRPLLPPMLTDDWVRCGALNAVYLPRGMSPADRKKETRAAAGRTVFARFASICAG